MAPAGSFIIMPIIKQTISKLAQSPEQSWKRFKVGVILFAASVALILVGSYGYALLQVPGLILLIIALFFSARGYLGILCYRLSNFKPPKAPPGL